MYIPYEKIGDFIYKLCKDEKIKEFFYHKKILQNIRFINKNKPNVLKRLNKKLACGEKLNVIFYVYDETKWKCQRLYDLLNSDKRFTVKVLVTKTACKNKDNPSYISDENLKKTYDYFKQKGVNAELAYDIQKSKFIPFIKFKPDVIFYQHPWYVKTEQGPVVCSKYALTCYIPYYYTIETLDIDCNLRFHKYVEKYYAMDDYTKQKCLDINPNLKNSIKTVGYPFLDNFCMTNEQKNEYIIYAPHWTVGKIGIALSTFEWSGYFLSEYAKFHPETKWIFKPHPLLKKALVDSGTMTFEEAERYYQMWDDIGIKYESGDYLELFAKSKMMITDSASFLGEYFITGKPLIHLMSETSPFKNSDNPILKTYYRASSMEELKNYLQELPENDYLKDLRLLTLKNMNLDKNNASQNIAEDILSTIHSL